jgi:ABC-type transport system involved in multi-copper enzyme maturation permease subunit
MGLAPMNIGLYGAMSTWLTPLWTVAVGAMVVAGIMALLAFLLRTFAPKMAAIAATSVKEARHQPVFYLVLGVGIFALFILTFVAYNTFGEDLKMFKANGLELIKVLAVILALWVSSVSISEEIEGRTALTLLSKPVSRRQLILGKFFGILFVVAILFVILGAVFLSTVSYKVVYDSRENSTAEPTSSECLDAIALVAPGLALSFMEAVVLASISVAISTRLPIIPNLVICGSIYALGNLVPVIVARTADRFPIVNFAGQLFAAIFPMLDFFSMESAISNDIPVPPAYLGAMLLYCVLYSTMAMLLALLLFEDRDVA